MVIYIHVPDLLMHMHFRFHLHVHVWYNFFLSASEPKFSNISNVNNGKQVSFSCDILFNGSSNVSSNLTVEDTSRSIVNSTVCSPNNTVTFCNLQYTTTANASIDQSYTCTVRLIANNSVIYARILNASLEWRKFFISLSVIDFLRKCISGTGYDVT